MTIRYVTGWIGAAHVACSSLLARLDDLLGRTIDLDGVRTYPGMVLDPAARTYALRADMGRPDRPCPTVRVRSRVKLDLGEWEVFAARVLVDPDGKVAWRDR